MLFRSAVGVGAAGKGPGGEAFAPRKRLAGASKRMGGALERMAVQAEKRRRGGDAVEEEEVEVPDEADVGGAKQSTDTAARSKAKGRKRKQAAVDPEDGEAHDDDGSDFEAPQRKARRGRGGAKSTRGRGKKAARAE